jgi:hypothetical protein
MTMLEWGLVIVELNLEWGGSDCLTNLLKICAKPARSAGFAQISLWWRASRATTGFEVVLSVNQGVAKPPHSKFSL